MKNKDEKLKEAAEIQAELFYIAGVLYALKQPIPPQHLAAAIARLELQKQILEQRRIKATKQIKEELTSLKNTFIYASVN